MKPAPFKYAACETVDEVVSVLAEHGDEAKVLAGGQSLVPLMNLRLATPVVLVDVNRVAELAGHPGERDARDRRDDPPGRGRALGRGRAQRAPLVVEALRHVAYPAVRSRGTIGGTVAHADPAAEIPAVLLALGGEVVARSPCGEPHDPRRRALPGLLHDGARARTSCSTAVRFPAARHRHALRRSQEVARKQSRLRARRRRRRGRGRRRRRLRRRRASCSSASPTVRSAPPARRQALAGRSARPTRQRCRGGRAGGDGHRPEAATRTRRPSTVERSPGCSSGARSRRRERREVRMSAARLIEGEAVVRLDGQRRGAARHR